MSSTAWTWRPAIATLIHEYAQEERRKLDREPPPVRPLLSGHDLKALGFVPGPAFRQMLDALVDAIEEEHDRVAGSLCKP